MKGALFDGKAFIKDGKLYYAENCPGCCEPCKPWRCCYETDKFWCGETSDYEFPKRIHGYIAVSGIPDTLRFEWIIQHPSPLIECPGYRQDSHMIVEFSGLAALNGTYIGTFEDDCQIEPPDSCASWTQTGQDSICRLGLEIPPVPITATFHHRRNNRDAGGFEDVSLEEYSYTGEVTLGFITHPGGYGGGYFFHGIANDHANEQAIQVFGGIPFGEWGWNRPGYVGTNFSVGPMHWTFEDHAVSCDAIDETNTIKSLSYAGGVIRDWYTIDPTNPCDSNKNWQEATPIPDAKIVERVWTE